MKVCESIVPQRAAQRDLDQRHLTTQLPLPLASHVPVAAARGFIFHHAEPDYVMMTHWLDDRHPSTLPPGPTHQVSKVVGRVGLSTLVMGKEPPIGLPSYVRTVT